MTGAAAGAAGPVRVFCAHRRVDRKVVGEFARRLQGDEIDVWLDQWAVIPGDDFVEKIEQGLEDCEVGLIFLSSTPGDGGRWASRERRVMVALQVERPGRRVIPVLLDDAAVIPPLLSSLDHRSIDDVDEIRAAILGTPGMPPPPEPESPPVPPGAPVPVTPGRRHPWKVLIAGAVVLGLLGALLVLVPLSADDRPETSSPDTTDAPERPTTTTSSITTSGPTTTDGDDPAVPPVGGGPGPTPTPPPTEAPATTAPRPSCPDDPSRATVTPGDAAGLQLVEASYDLVNGEFLTVGLRGQVTGQLGADEELRVFRNEDPASSASTVQYNPGRAHKFYMLGPYQRDAGGCWRHPPQRFGYSCLAGIDFTYHVAAVDRAEAALLTTSEGEHGLDTAEVLGNPGVRIIGSFEVPTENIPDCQG